MFSTLTKYKNVFHVVSSPTQLQAVLQHMHYKYPNPHRETLTSALQAVTRLSTTTDDPTLFTIAQSVERDMARGGYTSTTDRLELASAYVATAPSMPSIRDAFNAWKLNHGTSLQGSRLWIRAHVRWTDAQSVAACIDEQSRQIGRKETTKRAVQGIFAVAMGYQAVKLAFWTWAAHLSHGMDTERLPFEFGMVGVGGIVVLASMGALYHVQRRRGGTQDALVDGAVMDVLELNRLCIFDGMSAHETCQSLLTRCIHRLAILQRVEDVLSLIPIASRADIQLSQEVGVSLLKACPPELRNRLYDQLLNTGLVTTSRVYSLLTAPRVLDTKETVRTRAPLHPHPQQQIPVVAADAPPTP
jgi:hypothetical protein